MEKVLSWFDDFNMFFLNTAYKICRWKQKGGQKEDKGVKISKSNIWPIMLEMADLLIKSSSRKQKIFTVMILSAVAFSLYTNIVRGVALNVYKSSNQLETFSNRFLAKFPYIWTPEMTIPWKTLVLCKFWLWLAVPEKRWLKNLKLKTT